MIDDRIFNAGELCFSRRDFVKLASALPGLTLLGAGVADAKSETEPERDVEVPFSLDDLATAWLRRRITQQAAMPGLNNDLGSIQIEADIAAIKHPVFPPYSAGNEITALTLINGRSLAQLAPHIEIQWRAYGVERRCESTDWFLESQTALLPNQSGVVVRLKVRNKAGAPRSLRLGFLLSGRAKNDGAAGYAWSVPSIPTDVWSLTVESGLTQTVEPVLDGAGVCLGNEAGNAFSVQAFQPAPDTWERERVPTWSRSVKAGESFEISFLCTYHKDKQAALGLASQWLGREQEALLATRRVWETTWKAAFTPNNAVFSGHLPVVHSPAKSVMKLYYMGVLTLLTCRRNYGWGVSNPAYLTLWPRRGEGSVYLAWDLPYVSGILARLDPVVLKEMLRLTMSAPWLKYMVTNLLSGDQGSRACCTHPQAVTTSVFQLMRWQGDQSWRQWEITRKSAKPQKGPAANAPAAANADVLTGETAYQQALLMHRDYHLAGSTLADLGGRGPYLECITNYAHGTAGLSAVQAAALKEDALAFGGPVAGERAALLRDIWSLFQKDHGFFACLYPNGVKYDAPNLYDLGLVLDSIGEELPQDWGARIVRFVREELVTPTWAHCLRPSDLDSLSGTRADHQWSGSFGAWPAQFLLGAFRSGHEQDWMAEWMGGISKVTAQGPFGQAYWAEDMTEPEAGAAAKCMDELPQGNHWACSSGVYFAELVLDGIAGLNASVDGVLKVNPRPFPLREGLTAANIEHRKQLYVLEKGILRRS